MKDRAVDYCASVNGSIMRWTQLILATWPFEPSSLDEGFSFGALAPTPHPVPACAPLRVAGSSGPAPTDPPIREEAGLCCTGVQQR